ncbi:MAG TPA: Hint domain-containing protein [Chitinophagaceae bacterium]|nr:Hint domain-containing protein [Chitinophagaceae bacterium]
MKQTINFLIALILTLAAAAQDSAKLHSFSLEEYEKAKTFRIKDLDNDTYVKFENTYILDRYEGRKPYFITGDDGQKKRVDLYRLLLREGKQELGTIIFYTNEKGMVYQACLPNFRANPKVWEKYFEDIHAIDRQEANFVLKLSYVLSREFGFQLYKAANQGKDVSREAGTYGMDICFPGDEEVLMADGSRKKISTVQKGDRVVSINPVTHRASAELVTGLAMHEAKNYAITRLVLLAATAKKTVGAEETILSAKELNATPNHPVLTNKGQRKMSEIKEGDEILCLDAKTGRYERYSVWVKTEQAGGLQKVYNIETSRGSNFVVNEVMVLQK